VLLVATLQSRQNVPVPLTAKSTGMRFDDLRGKLLLTSGVPILAATVFCGLLMWGEFTAWREQRAVTRIATLTNATADLVHQLQLERGMSTGFLSSHGGAFGAELPGQRTRVDSVRQVFHEAIALAPTATLRTAASDIATSIDWMPALRQRVDSQAVEADSVMATYSALVARLLDVIDVGERGISASVARANVQQIGRLVRAKEFAARERGTLNGVFAAGRFSSPTLFRRWVGLEVGRELEFNALRKSADSVFARSIDSTLANPVFARLVGYREVAINGADGRPLTADATLWFREATAAINALHGLQTGKTSATLRAASAAALRSLEKLIVMGICAVVLVGGIAVTAWRTSRKILGITRLVTVRAAEVEAGVLQQLRDTVVRMARGDLSGDVTATHAPLEIRGNDELSRMGGNLDAMVQAAQDTAVAVRDRRQQRYRRRRHRRPPAGARRRRALRWRIPDARAATESHARGGARAAGGSARYDGTACEPQSHRAHERRIRG
jgi:hypothetical protein